jgi:hypothetical protein
VKEIGIEQRNCLISSFHEVHQEVYHWNDAHADALLLVVVAAVVAQVIPF